MELNNIVKDLMATRIVDRHRPYVWESLMSKYNCQTIAEIGVFKGVNFSQMIQHNPKVAIAVDSWVDDGVVSRNDGKNSQEIFERIYQEFKERFESKPFVKIYREYSFDAVKHFEDEYFDLVYIDAEHSFEGCLRDIEDWYPKVKKGRFLIGDDYRNFESAERKPGLKFGVVEAVNEFTKKNNLEFFELPSYGWAIIK